MPTIVLGTDEVDCFCAWVSAESGLSEHAETGSDLKVCDVNVAICWYELFSHIKFSSRLL